MKKLKYIKLFENFEDLEGEHPDPNPNPQDEYEGEHPDPNPQDEYEGEHPDPNPTSTKKDDDKIKAEELENEKREYERKKNARG
jgi:hypothetical protein